MYKHFEEDVTRILDSALSSLDVDADTYGIERSPEDVDSILASNVAFKLADQLGQSPARIADRILGEIDASESAYVGDVSTEGPYVNFFPSEQYFVETVRAAGERSYGHLESKDTSVVLEHTSPNPTGPLHVGRARNTIIGDSLRRILEMAGYDVETHCWVNDAGRQVALFTWAYETFDEADLPDPERDRGDYDLVRYYRKGNEFLEEAPEAEQEEAEEEIQSILQGIDEGDEVTYERVHEVIDRVFDGMRECLGRLPAEYDRFVEETSFIRDGSVQDVVDRMKELDCAVYEDDAWQLDLGEFGMDKNFVFLRSDGTTLYPTRDVAYHEWKLDNFDEVVTVLGEDHELQAREVRTGLELLGNDVDPITYVLYSYVNLPDGKMSTRAGTAVDLDDLLDEAIARAREEVEDRLEDRIRDDDLTEADLDRIAEQVGVGAVRFDVVARQPTKGITFDWEQALNFEAQSSPYVQYAHARACGIIENAPDEAFDDADLHVETPEERDLVRDVARFPALVEAAAEDLEPHTIAQYTRELAESFNAFYRECPVNSAEDPQVRRSRLAMVAAARNTLANALDLLGVQAPESM